MLKSGQIVALEATQALLARTGGNLEQAFVQIMNTPIGNTLEHQP
jgi:hypothetical protein